MAFDYTADGNAVFGGVSRYTSSYYHYVGGGSMMFHRCGEVSAFLPRRLIVIQFREGDRAWLKFEAERGKIRSIWIKKVRIFANAATGGVTTMVYFDNTNAVFNEEDLITNSEAINLALYYNQRRLYEAQKALECL